MVVVDPETEEILGESGFLRGDELVAFLKGFEPPK